MGLYGETESLDNKSAQNIESNFSFDMSKEEQDGFFSNIAQETSKLSSDRKNELFELFVQKSGILNNSSENKYLKNPILGMRFLSQFFANSDKESEIEKLYQEFDDFVMNDFAKMSNEIAIKNQAELYDRALTIKEELYEAIRFVELANKSVIGIGGGFSAGKSSFLNSILNSKEDILPVDIIPTTAIPTYVVTSDKNAIYTFNQYGDKAWIDEEGFLAISHEFNTIYSFGLSSIIKNIVVYSKDMPYQNIAFLDTPGYSKQDGYNQTDKKIAKEYLEDIGALIWLIDSDNGTIRKTDIDFLNELKIKESVNVLFVINKADKKPQSELKQIVERVKESLAKNFKRKFSITAYSSHDKKEYFGEDKIKRFCEVEDKTSVLGALHGRFRDVFDLYELHLKEAREFNKRMLSVKLKLINVIPKTKDEFLKILMADIKVLVYSTIESERKTGMCEEVKEKGLALLYTILKGMGVRMNTYSGCETKGYANEDKYDGEWKNSKRNGRGVMTYDDGTKYDGE